MDIVVDNYCNRHDRFDQDRTWQKPGVVYVDQANDVIFWAVEGQGRIYFDSLEQAREDIGPDDVVELESDCTCTWDETPTPAGPTQPRG